jgi:hypothetical protein
VINREKIEELVDLFDKKVQINQELYASAKNENDAYYYSGELSAWVLAKQRVLDLLRENRGIR